LEKSNRAENFYRVEQNLGESLQENPFKSLLSEGEQSESLQDDPQILKEF
jgi:hypothetical protein